MAIIEVGSTTTTFGPNGEVTSVTKKPSYLVNGDGTKQELTDEEAKGYGIGKDEPAMQNSMGYSCYFCHDTFLMGWKHTDTNRNYCNSCKEKSRQPKSKFVEKIY